MGYLSSSSTQSTDTGDLSAEGRQWNAMFTQLALSQLQEGGYEMNPVEKTEYDDPKKAKQYQSQIDNYQKQLDALNADLEKNPPKASGGTRYQDSRLIQQKQLQNRLFKAQDDLAKIGQSTYTDYQITKAEDVRVQDAISKYGENSPEVIAMRDQVQSEKVYQAESMAEVSKNYLENIKKLTSGDYSYTEEQKNQIASYFDPIKDVINSTTDSLLKEYGDNYDMLSGKLSELSTQIDQTGFDINDALEAAQVQIEKSGATLLDTLKKVNETADAKAQFEFDLLSEKIDKKNAAQAALLGLPPGSMMEKNQALKEKANALASIQLSLAEEASNKELGIVAQTEEGKKSISLAKVGLAESQGAKKENVAQMGLGLAADLASKKENLYAGKNAELIGLSKSQSNALMGAAVGQLPQMVSAGQSGLGFAQNMNAANLAYGQQLMNPISHALDIEQQRTFQESTTTQRSSPSIFSTLASGLGMASSAAGGIFQGLGAMNSGGSGGGNGTYINFMS